MRNLFLQLCCSVLSRCSPKPFFHTLVMILVSCLTNLVFFHCGFSSLAFSVHFQSPPTIPCCYLYCLKPFISSMLYLPSKKCNLHSPFPLPFALRFTQNALLQFFSLLLLLLSPPPPPPLSLLPFFPFPRMVFPFLRSSFPAVIIIVCQRPSFFALFYVSRFLFQIPLGQISAVRCPPGSTPLLSVSFFSVSSPSSSSSFSSSSPLSLSTSFSSLSSAFALDIFAFPRFPSSVPLSATPADSVHSPSSSLPPFGGTLLFQLDDAISCAELCAVLTAKLQLFTSQLTSLAHPHQQHQPSALSTLPSPSPDSHAHSSAKTQQQGGSSLTSSPSTWTIS